MGLSSRSALSSLVNSEEEILLVVFKELEKSSPGMENPPGLKSPFWLGAGGQSKLCVPSLRNTQLQYKFPNSVRSNLSNGLASSIIAV